MFWNKKLINFFNKAFFQFLNSDQTFFPTKFFFRKYFFSQALFSTRPFFPDSSALAWRPKFTVSSLQQMLLEIDFSNYQDSFISIGDSQWVILVAMLSLVMSFLELHNSEKFLITRLKLDGKALQYRIAIMQQGIINNLNNKLNI